MSVKSFNQNLTKFIEDLNITFPDYPVDLNYFNNQISENPEVFLEKLVEDLLPHIENISNYDETIFTQESQEFILLEKINISTYWERNISRTTKASIFNYLHILFITAHHHCKNTRENFENTIKNLTEDLENSENTNTVSTETFLKLINNVKKFKSKKQTTSTDGVEIDENDLFNHLEDTLGINSNGVIGGIAKDIMEELQSANLKEEDFSNPMNMFSMLMGGGGGKNNGLMDIVKNVGTKLHNRLESGNLDQNALFGETNEMMSKLGNSDSPFSNMFSNMFGGQMPKNMPNMSNIENNKQFQLMGRRERLRKKLEKKRRELAEAENLLENGESLPVVETLEKKKKKRRRKKKKKAPVVENS